ncbi:multidrug resistance efflux transporter family protein [Motilimonas cestriensis]|uniref:Multidrug resistance efflux transporter family protein n=1 Tax=Motilimonas cestriensis TaxID=2742685 RepID=A0ABS8W879_9GAMM|nr:multidrug resistance efflux transporter family protein [Motilimonas cestriensis]MCE2595209.1 multidrug resistance efflux transporter family protein [Motilimonas cestriensis]
MTQENRSISVFTLVVIGLLSAALFSLTFVINYSIALGSGSWVWTAVLRYLFTIIILFMVILVTKSWQYLFHLLTLLREHLGFWVIMGTFSCGFFYAGISFSSEYLRGWAVAATFQLTIIFSPFILLFMGYRFPIWILPFSVIVLGGAVLINWPVEFSGFTMEMLTFGVFPIIVSAIAYPFGNQLVNAAKNGSFSYIPTIRSPILDNAFSSVLLMCIGSIPFWVDLLLYVQPSAPSDEQYLSTFIVALFSGVLATSLFIYARNLTSDPLKIVAVDSTQSAEVLFALMLELLFVNHHLPSINQIAGLIMLLIGLLGIAFRWDNLALRYFHQ